MHTHTKKCTTSLLASPTTRLNDCSASERKTFCALQSEVKARGGQSVESAPGRRNADNKTHQNDARKKKGQRKTAAPLEVAGLLSRCGKSLTVRLGAGGFVLQ